MRVAAGGAHPLFVTAVERTRNRRGRLDIYINGERHLEVARESAKQHDLRPGRAVTAEELAAISVADARRTAMQNAASLLARRPRSEREIRRRLALRKHDPVLIDETVARLRAVKLLDDAEFARTWTESRDRSSPRGRRLIAQELRANGVDASLAHAAVADVEEPDAAYRSASARLRGLRDLDFLTFRARLGGYLQRRGFGWDTVRATVDRCWAELHDGHAPEDDFGPGIE